MSQLTRSETEIARELKKIASGKAMPAPIPISTRRAELQAQKVRLMKASANTGKSRRL